jgi:signal peptidase II
MKRKYWVLLIVAIWILSVDQWTKSTIMEKLPLHQSIKVVEGVFSLTHVRNTGGAFGIFGGARGGLGSVLFLVVSLVAIGCIFVMLVRLKDSDKHLSLSYSLILSGAVGNLIDRVRYGEVVDFLDFYISSFHWPAFNIADSAICVGIGLMALELLLHDHKKKKSDRDSRR